jgi:hypothetical protein
MITGGGSGTAVSAQVVEMGWEGVCQAQADAGAAGGILGPIWQCLQLLPSAGHCGSLSPALAHEGPARIMCRGKPLRQDSLRPCQLTVIQKNHTSRYRKQG